MIKKIIKKLRQNARQPKIAAVVNFCTNDYAFLLPCLNSLRSFCSEIVVPFCDKFYDGSNENTLLLNRALRDNPETTFIPFKYKESFSKIDWDGPTEARLVGWKSLKYKADYVLFVDCDEIFDPYSFNQWLLEDGFKDCQVIKFANYWYFRGAAYQYVEWEQTLTGAKSEFINEKLIKTFNERDRLVYKAKGIVLENVRGINGLPMVHHYSWVRTKGQMLKKTQTWSHRGDRDWATLIEQEFSQPFRGYDMVFNRKYREVEPAIKLELNAY